VIGAHWYAIIKQVKRLTKNDITLPIFSFSFSSSSSSSSPHLSSPCSGHLERVFFKLPAKCVSGQPFDLKPFDEMYAIDQCEEFDKKNRDFVENVPFSDSQPALPFFHNSCVYFPVVTDELTRAMFGRWYLLWTKSSSMTKYVRPASLGPLRAGTLSDRLIFCGLALSISF